LVINVPLLVDTISIKKGGKFMFVNGKEMNIKSGITVNDLIKKLNIDKDKIVVEVNFDIIRKEEYCDRILVDSDKIEIIAFVGGG